MDTKTERWRQSSRQIQSTAVRVACQRVGASARFPPAIPNCAHAAGSGSSSFSLSVSLGPLVTEAQQTAQVCGSREGIEQRGLRSLRSRSPTTGALGVTQAVVVPLACTRCSISDSPRAAWRHRYPARCLRRLRSFLVAGPWCHRARNGASGLRSTAHGATTRRASATFYTTGMEHAPTSATGTGWERTPWHATRRAAWEALRRADEVQGCWSSRAR